MNQSLVTGYHGTASPHDAPLPCSEEEEKSEDDMQDVEENPPVDDEDNIFSKRRSEIDDMTKPQRNDFQKGTKHSISIHKSDDRLEATAKSHRSHKKRQDNDNDSGSSSSSSSSSADDSSTYSSSDSDLDNRLKSIQKNAKKAEVLQKLSETIHAPSLSSGINSGSSPIDNQPVSCGNNSNLKRLPTDLSASVNSDTSADSPAAKKLRNDTPSGTSTISTDNELVNTVRKYLMRKPITVRELLKKIRLRKLVGKNEDAQTVLANVLRQLRPIKQTINGQHALSLKH
ncbi:unnamed protein product [Schistosoma curassoni]|uniref:Transcription initiation factor IIF subunit alpha n=1 Tax=Schistosoma curassoni TaxID=6186 RepID=A0A183KTN0_9TREM|nr:unnamed protein product [Schistosoma curassoni]